MMSAAATGDGNERADEHEYSVVYENGVRRLCESREVAEHIVSMSSARMEWRTRWSQSPPAAVVRVSDT